ncbi:reprolysin-like metallopeptidase [Nonomuraea sp. B12E4]|uniref:reprolysin-like metallopeptidase n=1 Tax=Nonomuraea sp. B12E4 TaxID=3153564 RepID=UPI00325D737A
MRKTLRWLGQTAAALALVGFTGTPASAAPITDNMYPTANTRWACPSSATLVTAGFCQTDNSTVTYYYNTSGISSAAKSAINTIAGRYNSTDLNFSYKSTVVWTGSGETDIVYWQGTIPDGYVGFAWCNDRVDANANRCDQHYVRFKSSTPSITTVCHETGHAVGLTHGANANLPLDNDDTRLGCMTNPSASSSLGAHNVDMINATY